MQSLVLYVELFMWQMLASAKDMSTLSLHWRGINGLVLNFLPCHD